MPMTELGDPRGVLVEEKGIPGGERSMKSRYWPRKALVPRPCRRTFMSFS
jgi:hypothetical protein